MFDLLIVNFEIRQDRFKFPKTVNWLHICIIRVTFMLENMIVISYCWFVGVG